MRSFIFLLLGLAILGCASVPKADVQAQLDEPFTLKIGQTAYLQSEDVFVKLVGIPEDSRCPSDVVCVWAGQVKAALEVRKGPGAPQAINVTYQGGIGLEFVEEFDGHQITLVKVEPYPKSTQQISPSEYTATIRVSKK
jgi:hypothetical protein